MELGGNIELVGFDEHDGNDLVIIKKIIGNFVKRLSEQQSNLSEVTLTLEKVGSEQSITITVVVDSKEVSVTSSDTNLYYALDSAIKELKDEL